MVDREKVIKGLECCRIQQNEVPPRCEECPYADNALGTCEDMSGLLNDAYKMLKAQEPEALDAPKPDSDIGCWYDITHNYTLEQVVNALKAQEPRVMTLEEACSDIDFCWLEIKDYQAVWVSDCVIMPNGRQVLIERLGCDPVAFKPEDYGKTWRCWENESTDDQRKAVKWE